MKLLLVDNEKEIRSVLKELVITCGSGQHVIEEADGVVSGLEKIHAFKPDIVLLDVEMNDGTGFDLLRQLPQIGFQLIFTTAHNEYAVQAFKFSAIDYLLKPIDINDIKEALTKYENKELSISKDQIQNLHVFTNGKMQDTIALSTQQGLLFVKIDDIMYLEASSCYTYIVMSDKTKHLASKTMATFEEVLNDNALFFRTHKSHIVNLKFIKQYIRGEGGELIMQDGNNIALSRNRKQEFLNLFKKI